MKQYLLTIIAVLAAIILALFSPDTANNPYSTRYYRTYSYNPATNAWSGTGNGTLSALQEDNAGSVVAPPIETNATAGSLSALSEAGSPLGAPPAMLEVSAMTELTPVQLPPLDAGMVNVTGGFDGNGQTAGYRVYSRPGEFAIAVPYDPSLLPQGFTEDDIQTYVYDRGYHRWVAIQRDSVYEAEMLVCSRFRPWEKGLPHTQNDLANPQDALAQVQDMMSFAPQGEGDGDSPLDFINAVLKTPEMPETSAYTPTSIKELKAADPLEGLTLMQPPTANNNGTANLSYPIEIPAGRQGMQPNLALTYSSGGGNGWLGVGWDISIPSITVETRWGVPRYDQSKESEVYVYEGEQLVTKDGNGNFREMPHRTNQWTNRYDLDQDGYEQFFPRKNEAFDSIVRHGNGPSDYWWSVTHKNGVTDYYGKYASDNGVNNNCVLRADTGNTVGAIAHWVLAESIDPFGNSVKYCYDIVYNAGIIGSVVKGKQIYINSIQYTNHHHNNTEESGKYTIAFYRKSGRNDVVIAANRGFKEVTADVLCYVEVLFDTAVVRRYAFFTENKRESQYKTRLTDILRVDTIRKFPCCTEQIETYNNDSTFQGTRTHFDYYDAPMANAVFGDQKTYILAEDHVKSTFVSQGFNNLKGKATALGGTRGFSWSLGGTISVGVGANVCMTTVSVGGNFDYNRSQSEGLLTLIDLDGDGLADKVFKNNNGVFYRKRLPSATDSIVFASDTHCIAGVSDFLHETTSTTTWGAQASAGCSFSGGWPTTKSTTSNYFADVNADGLPDLITKDGVLFNTTQQGGLVTFKSFYTILDEQQVSDNDPITVNTSVPCGTFIFDGEASDSLACEVDWILDRYEEIKSCQTDQYEAMMVVVDSLINTGIYRVSYEYPIIDTLHYDPDCDHPYKFWFYKKEIRCTPKPLDPDVDAVRVWVAQQDGNISISSRFSLLEEDSESRRQSKQVDGVRYTIQYNSAPVVQNGVLHSDSVNEFYNNVVPKDFYDTIPMDTIISVNEGDILFFRLQSQGSRYFDVASWDIDIQYTDGSGLSDQYGRDADHYSSSEDFTVSGRQFFQTYAEEDTVHVTITINEVEDQSLGYGGYLVMRWSQAGDIDSLEYDLSQYSGTTISEDLYIYQYDSIQFFGRTNGETNWGAVEIRPHIESTFWTTTSTGNYIKDTLDYYPPVYIDYNNNKGTAEDSLEHRLFGPLYRGWGQFAYNNNDTSLTITDSIDISSLRLSSILVSTNPNDTANIYQTPQISASSSQSDAASALAAQGMYYPLSDSTRWIEMQPESRYWAWVGYGNINYVMRDTVTNTRIPDLISAPEAAGIPEYDHPVPQGGQTDGGTVVSAKTVRKQNRSELKNYSMNAGIPVVPISVGGSESNGGNRILTDYMDLNGDRYPDLIGEVAVQYSMPWGGIGKVQEISQHVQGVSNSSTYSEGTTYGASYTMPTRGTSNNPKNSKITFDGQGSAGGSLGSGKDVADYSLMDINGDGLPDMVDASGMVALNVGYSFLPFEKWSHGYVRNGESDNDGTNFGPGSFNIAQASIGGGVGVNNSENTSNSMLMDFNGDGLPDQVSKTYNGLSVRYNYGNGQWSPSETVSGVHDISHGISYSESANAGVTLGYTLFGFLKITGGVQTSPYNQTFSKDSVQITDINGDGYPDYVTSQSENNMKVRYNQSGKVNLLRKVTNFTGNTIEMDYALSTQCFEKPQRGWNLDTLTVADPNSPLTGNVSSMGFRYGNPNYNRAERMDYGYGTVITYQYDMDGGGTLYRYTVEEFNNVNFTKRGRKIRNCIYDAANRPYIEHLYDATVYDLADSIVSEDGCARADVYVGTESDLTNYFEGQSTAQITSRIIRRYDRYRNVTEYIHYGDTTHHDEWFKAEIEYAAGMQHNLVALPVQIVVKNYSGNTMQKRTASYFPTGKLQQLVRHNGNGNAQYDFTYDTYGNLSSALMPQNLNGQRLLFTYQYDNSVHTYPIRVDNVSLGFFSTASYDLKFGKPTRTVDINGNEMRYQYDHMGRNTVILAPYEIDAGQPYTIRMEYHPKNYGTLNISGSGGQSYACTYHYDCQHQSNPIRTTIITDGLGRVLQTKKDAEVDGHDTSLVTGRVIYDCFGRTVGQYHPFLESLSSYPSYNAYFNPNTLTVTEYDILDRQTRVVLPTHEVTRMEYGFGNIGGKTVFSTITTDALNNSVQVLKGTLGQQLKQVAPYGTTTLFEYDCLGQLKRSTDPDGFETFYEYDMFGQMIHRKHPDAGNDKYEYDPAGNLIRHTNEMGESLDYKYYFNQLTDITCSHYPEYNVHYKYGTSADAVINAVGKVILQEDASGWQTFAYGKLGEVTGNIRTFTLPYEQQPYTFDMRFVYDSWNRIDTMVYPDGEIVCYGYNSGGMLNSITGSKNGLPYKYLDSVRYNEFELKSAMYYGNGTKTFYKYDILQRLDNLQSYTAATTTSPSEIMQDIYYKYDSVSNIIDISNYAGTLLNGLGGKYGNTYKYNNLYRLEYSEGAWYGNHPVGYKLNMEYTPNGRIMKKYLDADTYTQTPFSSNQSPVLYQNDYHYTNNNQPNTLTYIDNSPHQDFKWDVKGNLIFHYNGNVPFKRFLCWDEQNRLLGVKDDKFLSYYQYDANGDRIYKLTGEFARQNQNGEWRYYYYLKRPTLYASPYLVTNPKGYTKHYYAENERIASRMGGGGLYDIDRNDNPEMFVTHKERSIKLFAEVMECLETQAEVPESLLKFLYEWKDIREEEKECYWYHPDHLGSSSWITFSDGKAVEHLHYMPWGEDFVRQRSTDWHAMYTFSAKEKDAETGYSYFGSRYYSSELSIWLSVDPMSDKYPSLNPYTYCANNPVKLVDPNGEEVEYNSFADRIIVGVLRIFDNGFRKQFRELKKSEETYVFNKNNDGKNSLTTDGNKLFINYSMADDGKSKNEGQTIFSNLRHETTHAIQFEHGEIGFVCSSGKWSPIAYDLADEYEAHNNQNRGYRRHNKVDNSRRKWNNVNKESKIRALRNVPAYSKLPIEQQNCPNKQKEHTSNSYALPYRKRLQN